MGKKTKTITAQDFKVDSITSFLGLATHTVTYGDNEVRSFECLSPTKEGRNKFDTFWTEAKIQHTDASRFTTCRMFQGQDLVDVTFERWTGDLRWGNETKNVNQNNFTVVNAGGLIRTSVKEVSWANETRLFSMEPASDRASIRNFNLLWELVANFQTHGRVQ